MCQTPHNLHLLRHSVFIAAGDNPLHANAGGLASESTLVQGVFGIAVEAGYDLDTLRK